MSDLLLERVDDHIMVVTLNRPTRLNALTRELVAEINTTMDTLAADRSVRAIVLTGAGKGFCAGQDMAAARERQSGPVILAERYHWQEQFAGMAGRIRAAQKLVVGAINGAAVGAGMSLALGCDVRFLTPNARLLIGAVRIGLSGGESGISYFLPRLIGAARAFDVLLTGREIGAEEAERLGLAKAIVPAERIVDEAVGYARLVLENSPFSIAHTKRLMWHNLDNSYDQAVELENRTQMLALLTPDYAEATAAFVEKRKPNFTG